MRVYGVDDGSSHGDIKLKTWDNASGLFSEARGGVQVWDGLPHTWTVAWDETTATRTCRWTGGSPAAASRAMLSAWVNPPASS